jgi:hypothetical protein
LRGKWGGVGGGADAGLERLYVIELKPVAAVHEVYDVAALAMDGIHAEQVRVAIEAYGVELIFA